ncbi:hypothetical protein NIES3804_37450 [Microcystis aeruginosa NIES-3804]|uniref:Uncharacterized protein n=1 Tax=Microcystis aeruginosa NIES-3804 TaxID=2517783 RepID=A0A6H9GMU2_MICAE|nr:hypothetical protein NIES3804_37450 [Microcystis aeruginosa NIES-3804]
MLYLEILYNFMPIFLIFELSKINYSSFHQNEAWAWGLSPLLAKLVDTSVT